MPELPEVETIVRGLGTVLPGKIFWQARVMWARSLATPEPDQFSVRLAGQHVERVERRGKFIVIGLQRDTLLVHLRMSGDLRLAERESEDLPHDRVAFQFEDSTRLVFNDARKFGRIWLVKDPVDVLGGLGPEPLDPGLNVDDFTARLHSHKRQIKPLLLDQTFLAGMGNIYTDEALFLAGVHPNRLAVSIDSSKGRRLFTAIRTVLEEGIRRNGASIDWVYRGGDFQNHFKVYQRAGQACPVCGTVIQRIVVGQRGTHFCPVCQPES